MSSTTVSSDDPTPTVIVLFGATGDLARRMVIPALFQLHRSGLAPDLVVVGNGRGDLSDANFRAEARDACEASQPDTPIPAQEWESFAGRLLFAGHGFTVDDPGELPARLTEADEQLSAGRSGPAGRLWYLAVPPEQFEPVTRALGEHGLAQTGRVVFEKPFGTSAESFASLDDAVHEVLDETQIFRIDHFLGKEATSDLHVVRFANGLFACAWDRDHIRSVQIDVPETLDVANRGAFYDRTGAVLDMIVTHLVQLAAEVAMEPPASLAAADVAMAREAVLGHLRPVDPDQVVLGQYDGYQQVHGVAQASTTETYAALQIGFDSPRWQGVPFILRTGKALAASRQLVTVEFEPPAVRCGFAEGANTLRFDLAGSGSVGLGLLARTPSAGAETDLAPVDLQLPLTRITGQAPPPAYVGLLLDVLRGDRSRFTRPDGLRHVWDAFGPLLEARGTPVPYAAGSRGPSSADRLVAPTGWFSEPPIASTRVDG
jgi:glucose-6-phosphate 1-dehydrogenase